MPPHDLVRGAQMLSPVEAHVNHRFDLLEMPENFGANLAQRHLSGGAYFASELIQGQRIRSLLNA